MIKGFIQATGIFGILLIAVLCLGSCGYLIGYMS